MIAMINLSFTSNQFYRQLHIVSDFKTSHTLTSSIPLPASFSSSLIGSIVTPTPTPNGKRSL